MKLNTLFENFSSHIHKVDSDSSDAETNEYSERLLKEAGFGPVSCEEFVGRVTNDINHLKNIRITGDNQNVYFISNVRRFKVIINPDKIKFMSDIQNAPYMIISIKPAVSFMSPYTILNSMDDCDKALAEFSWSLDDKPIDGIKSVGKFNSNYLYELTFKLADNVAAKIINFLKTGKIFI